MADREPRAARHTARKPTADNPIDDKVPTADNPIEDKVPTADNPIEDKVTTGDDGTVEKPEEVVEPKSSD